MKSTRRGILAGLGGVAIVARRVGAFVIPGGGGAGSSGGGGGGPPVPIAVTLTPSSAVVLDTATLPVTLCSIAPVMSDGSTFAGSLTENTTFTSISGTSLRLDSMPPDGLISVLVTATQNSVSASATFSVTVTATSVTTIQGTGFPAINSSQTTNTASPSGGFAKPVAGMLTLSFSGGYLYGYNGTGSPGNITGQWMLDETPIGPQITVSNQPNPATPPAFTLNYDTVAHGVPDGTHIAWFKFLEHTSDSVYSYTAYAQAIIVHNTAYKGANVAQTVACTNNVQIRLAWPTRPDYVAYPGNPNQQNTGMPFPYSVIAKAGGPITPPYVNGANTPYFMECVTAPTTKEYNGDPVWSTLSPLETGAGDGGVWVQPVTVESGGRTGGTSASTQNYFVAIALNPNDGGRCGSFVGGISTLVEAPDGSAWYGVELQGRLFKMPHTGGIQTVAGFTKDFTKLAYNTSLGNDSANEDLMRTRQVAIGNFNPGADDLGTAVDLCFDPRNANIAYVCMQGDSYIAKVDMTSLPPTITPYAGTRGSPGYFGDGGPATSAKFDNCNSIIMTDGVHGPDPAGVMYVADTNNCVIRKITSPSAGVPGTISTFLGYQPARPTRVAFEAATTVYSPGVGSLPFSTFAGPSPTSYMPYPFTLRFTHDGDILVFQNENVQVRRINFGSSTVTHVGYFQQLVVTASISGTVLNVTALNGPSQLGAGWSTQFLIDPSVTPGTKIISNGTGGGGLGTYNLNINNGTVTSRDIVISRVVGDAWGWIAVDTAAAIGATDDIVIASALSIDGTAENYWRIPITGGIGVGMGSAFQGTPYAAGTDTYCYHGWGHYPWAAAISTHEGRAVFSGVSDRGIRVVRLAQPADPTIGDLSTFSNGIAPNLNSSVLAAGEYIWSAGTVAGRGGGINGFPGGFIAAPATYPRPFPFNSRPSFISIHGNIGSGLLGNSGKFAGASSFDEMLITYPTDAALTTFIQAGMAGSVPRPEISGNDMRDLIYFIRRNSIVGATDNGGHAVQPGPDDPDTGNYPTITSISAVRNSATSITVSWTTDKPTLGFAMCGSAFQQTTSVPFPVFSEIETPTTLSPLVYPTTHSATIDHCPSGPMYFSACAKDLAGNSVHANAQGPI